MDWRLVLFRLVLSLLFGGLIGIDRQKAHRPAGLRTHILVCVGSALVMLTGEFLFEKYKDVSNLDPARLGAQVISGIGFLGAGTIIVKKGSVQGLTTAASLWAVACAGISIGTGFYWGALFSSVLIYFTLLVLRRFERNKIYIIKHIIKIRLKDENVIIKEITKILKDNSLNIKEVEKISEEGKVILIFTLVINEIFSKDEIMESILMFKNVEKIEFIEV